jgi:small subunit ribosomal protein S1
MENNITAKSNIRDKAEKGASLKKIYDEAFPEIQAGQIVKGKIVRVVANGAIVDLGLKSEAFLTLDEFAQSDEITEGQTISVLVESLENKEGVPVISKRKADFEIAWNVFEEKFSAAETMPAKVIKKVKGGLIVDLLSQEAFLPGSQIDVKPVFNFDSLIGQTFDVKILSMNPSKNNIVVSRRVIIEEKINEARARVFSSVKIGDVVEGTVTSIADFGVFVDIDGVDALLHISDLSWDKVVHPKEVVNISDKIQVKVLNLDPQSFRITVGRKQLEKHPWEEIEQKYQMGTRVKGTVTALAEYGAFLELEKNIEGLIHISEMSWTKAVHHPSQILRVGDMVEAVVLNIDRDNRRISLGLKQALPDPWSVIEDKFQIGQKIDGRVTSLKNFGAFVEIEAGIEGLIRNIDLSWTKRVRHPREVVKKNQKIEAIILDIDKENREMALGLKQTQEDPFYRLSTEFKVGDLIEGRIVELARLGIVVTLPYGIEGYVPRSQLISKFVKKEEIQEGGIQSSGDANASPSSKYQVGDKIELKIAYIDFEMRKIGLSEKALLAVEEVREPSRYETSYEEKPEKIKPRRPPSAGHSLPSARRSPRRKIMAEQDEAIEEEIRGSVKFTFEDHLDEKSKIKGKGKKPKKSDF